MILKGNCHYTDVMIYLPHFLNINEGSIHVEVCASLLIRNNTEKDITILFNTADGTGIKF